MQKTESCYLSYLESHYCSWESHGFSAPGFQALWQQTLKSLVKGQSTEWDCSWDAAQGKLGMPGFEMEFAPETEPWESLKPPKCLIPPHSTDLAWLKWAAGTTGTLLSQVCWACFHNFRDFVFFNENLLLLGKHPNGFLFNVVKCSLKLWMEIF